MLVVYCLAFLAFELVSGAKIPPPPPGPSTPVFQDECKDPALNDCPVASVCVDQFYGFTCKCKPGYVDKSSDKDNPGRLCVLAAADGTTEAAAQETPQEVTTPAVQSTKRHRSKGSKSKVRTEAPKVEEVTKSPLDELAKDSVSQVSPKPKSHRKSKNRNHTATTPAPEEDKPKETTPEDSESSKAALRDTFTFFDANQDGQIDLNELKVATKALNQTISTDRLRQMLATADRNGDGTVNFAEFRALMRAQPPPQ